MESYDFLGVLKEENERFKPYASDLLEGNLGKIDFSEEPDEKSIGHFFKIPYFDLFSHIFTNKSLHNKIPPEEINAFHYQSSLIIPETHNQIWQYARRLKNHVNLLSCGSSSIDYPEFFINFCEAYKSLEQDKINKPLDKILFDLFEEFGVLFYDTETSIPLGGNVKDFEKLVFPVPLDEEPIFELLDTIEKDGLKYFSFRRQQGNLGVHTYTPWNLTSKTPPLLEIVRESLN